MISLPEQYEHPLWQKKKYAIYERDGWSCRLCKRDCYELASQLHAHHLYRVKNLLLWEYDDDAIVTLCAECHELIDSSEIKKIAGIVAFNMLSGELDLIDLTIKNK